ncbi:hypothetical protein BH09BAC1_BH09BAC1_14470 [soil metagenome]
MKRINKLAGFALLGMFFMGSATVSNLQMNAIKAPGASGRSFEFQPAEQIEVGTEMMPLIGQLSKDGRTMYLTGQSHQGKKYLYKMNRPKLGAGFSKPEKVTGDINGGKYDIIMPTVSKDEQTMVFVHSANGMQSGNDLYLATKNATGEYSSIRSLDEVNDPNVSDSYPWLSSDGLRIYFTKQHGSKITFFVSERSSLDANFSKPSEMGVTLPKTNNNMSCYLSSDEKEFYALSGESIFYASRKSAKDKFSVPVEIANTSSSGYLSGIAITDDASEMFVYNSVGFRNTQIIRFVNKSKDVSPGLNAPAGGK